MTEPSDTGQPHGPAGATRSEPQKTPLCSAHTKLGARMVEFGGWLMPVQYSGIIDEHRTTRAAVGLFDACHMGEVHFRGPRAAEAVQRLVTNDVSRLVDGKALYTVACNSRGGIVDDLIVYRVAPEHFLIVINAANITKDVSWFRSNVGKLCEIVDASPDTGLIAVQGPKAEAMLQPLTRVPLERLRSFEFVPERDVAGIPCWISRTGYTGEDGFELFCRSSEAEMLWTRLVDAARGVGGKPAGLGARDTLRLEARLSLYGNDLSDDTSPLEAGLGWVVKLDTAADFIGKDVLLLQRSQGVTRKLVGLVMIGRGVARHGYGIHTLAGERVGEVTSGTFGPTVEKNIALGYVPAALADPGTRLLVDCRGKQVEAEVVKGPFYKRSPSV